MGCSNSKVNNLPLVIRCRERRDYIKTASDSRYALAAAHLTYFQSLKQIGDALCKFVDEDLLIGGDSSPDSPVLTLPSDEGKPHKTQGKSSSSSSISASHSVVDDVEDSHLHLSSDSETDSDSGHIHIESSPEPQHPSFVYSPNSYPPNSSGFGYPPQNYGYPSNSSENYGYPSNSSENYGYPSNSSENYGYPPPFGNMYYMRRSETPAQTYIYGEPQRYTVQNVPSPGYGGDGGFFGFSMGSPPTRDGPYRGPDPPAEEPPPPPEASSGWDIFNVFEGIDNGDYGGGYFTGRSMYRDRGSAASSPDSNEVRKKEGIPDLEDETEQEQEVMKEVRKEKKKANEESDSVRNANSGGGPSSRRRNLQRSSGEGTSRDVPKPQTSSSEGSSGTVHLHSSESSLHSVHEKEIKSSPDVEMSKSSEEERVKKKRVSFEFEEVAGMDVGSSKGSSLTTLSTQGTRDVQEVVQEIRDEFETASSYGREVALLLEVGKLPYQSRVAALKVIFSRILYLVAPSMVSSHPSSKPLVRLSHKMIKMAKAYHGEPGEDFKSGNLAATLEKLHAWEKKLYKEVKDEEKLRVFYEKECKRLKRLDDHGAESAKIDATQASVRKLLTKINVCIRAVDAISRRIQKLRDEELLPQVTELIHGLIRMWKSMLNCHQKQFKAIMESKLRSLKVNANLRKDSGLKATLELEMELLSWCSSFNSWVDTQKSYVESLNSWLSRCINSKPEVTPDGVAPFSPSRVGAPPIFVICSDWFQAMERISQQAVADAMFDFASTLHQLWERQDEAKRQRMKAESLSKDLEDQIRKLRIERMKRNQHGHEASSDKSARSKTTTSESGVSALDDLTVDLDSMRKRFSEEKARHKEAIKLVNSAASNSLQTGLIPIFEALGSFTSEALKVHEQVRVPNVGV